MKFITQEQASKVYVCLRYLIYFALTVGFAYSLHLLAAFYHGKTFVEHGIVENLQIACLWLSTFIFSIQIVLLKKHRALLILFASFCCFASIRELDSFFEIVLPLVSWKFACLFPIGAIGYLIYDRKQAAKSITDFIGTPAFSLMTTLMFIFIAVAQVIGNKELILNSNPGLQDAKLIRRLLEEGTELIAYFLLVLSSVEVYFSMKCQDKKQD